MAVRLAAYVGAQATVTAPAAWDVTVTPCGATGKPHGRAWLSEDAGDARPAALNAATVTVYKKPLAAPGKKTRRGAVAGTQ